MKFRWSLILLIGLFSLFSEKSFGVLVNDASFINESWADVDINAGGTTNRIGWFLAAGTEGADPAVEGGRLTVTMEGATGGQAKVSTGGLDTYSDSGLFPTHYILTARVNVEQFCDVTITGSDWPAKGVSLVDSRRDFRLVTMLTPTNIWVNSGALWTEIAITTVEDTFYTWQFEVDDSAGTVDIYRRGSDTDAFVEIATNILLRNQNATDQVMFGLLTYNGENTQNQGKLVADYFRVGRSPVRGALLNGASLVDQNWSENLDVNMVTSSGTATNRVGFNDVTGAGGTAPSIMEDELVVTMVGATDGVSQLITGSLDAYEFHSSSNYIVSTRMKVVQFPDAEFDITTLNAGINFCDIRGMDRLYLHLEPDGVWVNHANNDWVLAASITTAEDTYYTWQFEVNQVDGVGAGTVDIYRRESDADAWTTVATVVVIRDQNAADQILVYPIHFNGDNTQIQGTLISDYFQIGDVPEPILYVSFDESFNGIGSSGVISPSATSEVSFSEGVSGRALQVGNADGQNGGYVEYANVFSNSAGTVMFWVQPNGLDTTWPTLQYNLFSSFGSSSVNDSENHLIRMFINRTLSLSLSQDDSDLKLLRYIGEIWPRGEWRHLAFSWNQQGEVQLYVNGLPYQHGKQSVPQMKTRGSGNVLLQDIQRVYLGTPPDSGIPKSKAGMAFDEFKVFDVALSDRQVSAEYRQVAPVDMVVTRRFLRAGINEFVEIKIAAGGVLETPVTGITVSVPIQVEMELELATLAGDLVKSDSIAVILAQESENILMLVGSLSAGSYRLTCKFPWQGVLCSRVFALEVYDQALISSNISLQLGGLIESVDCSQTADGFLYSGSTEVISRPGVGTYREAGTNKFDRFSYELEFPEPNGSPVVLEIIWPDDKPRSMGLYMYRESSSLSQNRDRLGGGVQSGVEYPCAGGMTSTRYLFYPWFGKYLFEARTMIPGYPAAVSQIKVHSISGRLPKLSVLTPEGEDHRLLGHMDEDQTFDLLINGDLEQRGTGQKRHVIDVLESLLDYLDYTGQNAMNYAFMRYDFLYQDLPGSYDGIGFQTKGWQRLILDMFEQRGKKLIMTCNTTGLPENLLAPDLYAQEYMLCNRSGDLAPADSGGNLVNPVHPDMQQLFLRHINDALQDFGIHPACAGLDLWFLERKSLWSFHSLENGYGDFTVGLFELEEGIDLGVNPVAIDRFEQRYQLLTGIYRTEWLQWRADQTTELISQVDALIQTINPNLSLYLSLAGWGRKETENHLNEEEFNFTNLFYETYAMDLEALASIPSVRLTPQRQPTWYRWQKWWNNEESTGNELVWAPDKFSDVRATGRAASWSYHRYFESFMGSLDAENFKSSFQSADVKPHGRYFQQELVNALAATDAQALLLGGQPMGMAGRDEQAREFARAYRALPAGGFADVSGSQDPVVVRYLQTANATYVYAANLNFFSQTGSVFFAGSPSSATNLSSGESVALNAGSLSVELRPFELCSFRLSSSAVPTNWLVSVQDRNTAWIQDKFEQITNLTGSAASELTNLVASIQAAIDNDELADAYRLITSKALKTGEIPPYISFPSELFIDENWADLNVYAGASTNNIGWFRASGTGGPLPALNANELTITMEGTSGGASKIYTGGLYYYSTNGTFTSRYLITTRVKVEQFPDIDFSENNGLDIEGINLVDIRRQRRLIVVLTPNALWINNTTDWTKIAVNTASNVYFTWQFDVDDEAGTVDVYRRSSDALEFDLYAGDIPIRNQDVADQIVANVVYYNEDYSGQQGILKSDYFQVKGISPSALYVSFAPDQYEVVASNIYSTSEFFLLQVESQSSGNTISWYTSDDFDSDTVFAVYRATSLSSGWVSLVEDLPRNSAGTNSWEDVSPPVEGAAFYRVESQRPLLDQ